MGNALKPFNMPDPTLPRLAVNFAKFPRRTLQANFCPGFTLQRIMLGMNMRAMI
jgi:hypothetical protein